MNQVHPNMTGGSLKKLSLIKKLIQFFSPFIGLGCSSIVFSYPFPLCFGSIFVSASAKSTQLTVALLEVSVKVTNYLTEV